MITFKEYETNARATARYRNIDSNIKYAVAGLCGESGEVMEHAKKADRDDGGKLTSERREKAIKEAGDVLWYAAAIAWELNTDLETIMEVPSFAEIQRLPYRGETFLDISLELCMFAGRLGGMAAANVCSDGRMTECKVHRRLAHAHLRGVMYALVVLATILDTSLADIAKVNNDKLAARVERGTIHGSGDER
jgi:NTP pyrophosphatase (non-canonical NTP hydrolase)